MGGVEGEPLTGGRDGMAGTSSSDTPLVCLLDRAREGDDGALEHLLRALYLRIRLYSERWCRADADGYDRAQDMTQETLLRVATNLHQCTARTDAELVGWSLTAARNLGVDRRRAERQEQLRLMLLITPAGSDVPGGSSGLSPQLRQLALRAYGAEPVRVQELLWHRLVESCTWAEVGESLATTEGGAKRTYQRACARLRRRIDRLVQELPPSTRVPTLAEVDTLASGPPPRA